MRHSLAVVAVILVTVTTALAQGSPGGEPDKDVEAIKKVVMAQADAWNRMDMKDYAELFAPDVDFVTIRGHRYRGKEETMKGHWRILDTVMKNSQLKELDIEVRFLRPDVAIAHSVSEMITRDLPGAETPARSQKTYVLVKGVDERWLVTAFQNTRIRERVTVPAEGP